MRRTYRMNRQSRSPLEGRAVLAYRDHRLDELVVYTSTQVPHIIRLGLSEMLGLEERNIRVIAPDVGGGFGSKARLSPEEAAVAALALEVDHPCAGSRIAASISSPRPTPASIIIASPPMPTRADALLGIDVELIVDGGAYAMWPNGPFLETGMAARNLPGPYNIRNYRVKTYTVATNKSPIGPYRGVGRPGACFAIERTIDEVARAVGRDPLEVRMDNMVTSAQMPYTTIANMQIRQRRLPGGGQALRRGDRSPRRPRAAEAGRGRRPADRRGVCLLFRTDRPRLRRMGEPRQPVHPGLRELHRAH